jgi:hypothetical protein
MEKMENIDEITDPFERLDALQRNMNRALANMLQNLFLVDPDDS